MLGVRAMSHPNSSKQLANSGKYSERKVKYMIKLNVDYSEIVSTVYQVDKYK